MTRLRPARLSAVVLVTTACAIAAAPSASSANPICSATGVVSGVAGKACSLATHAGKVVGAGKKLVGGHVGGAVKSLLGGGGSTTASTAIGLAAIGAWVLGGAKFALDETAKVLSQTTTPQLRSTWFSSTYWRISGIAAVLTLPFLFAAAIQALLRSDLALLVRAALGYLPVAMLAVSIAAPLTMLLLSASDELSAVVSSAAGQAGVRLLGRGAALLGALTVLSGSPFIAFLIGVLTAGAALVLWLELLMREAAVYVIVLLLPLVFAAFVWPARRIWAVRSVELLVALILSKFAIVAVLSLGGVALTNSGLHSVTASLAGIVLLLMGAFAPWALLRFVPLAELASGAAGALRTEGRSGMRTPVRAAAANAEWSDTKWGNDWAAWMMSGMRRQADEAWDGNGSTSTHSSQGRLAELAAASGWNGSEGSNGAGGSNGARGSNTVDESNLAPGSNRVTGSGNESPIASSGTAEPSAASEQQTADAPAGSGGSEGVPPGDPHGFADAPAGTGGSEAAPPERIPGLGPMWQAPDGGWRPIVLGPGTTSPPPRPWPVDEPGDAPPESAPPADPGQAGLADERDPRPPRQPPEDGPL